MTPARWQQIEGLYLAAKEREPAARESFLTGACGDDAELRARVESMLAQDGRLDRILDIPAAGLLTEVAENTAIREGAQLGPYRIEALLGEGGMGRVYQARDTRLDRPVAIKILHSRFEARFESEAHAISALNHPHICTLHDIGAGYLVMELIEGETLAARLKKGALGTDLALRYGAQIAGALAAAHAKGIVHRDLKPGNIMVTRSGIKVLDFGLAKKEGEAPSGSSAVMGTPGYMAPEQREGKRADARTDIFALGLVLYEMATGKRVQAGERPQLDALPEKLAHVVERAIEPDPEGRWQSARDVKAEIEWAREPEPAATAARTGRHWWTAAAIALALGALGGWMITHVRQSTGDERVVRFQIEPPAGGQFLLRAPLGGIALSPDGRTAAYVASVNGKSELWVRPLDSTDGHPLAGTESAQFPFWSPDSRFIAFSNGRRLQRVEVAGGEPLTISDDLSIDIGRGGAWLDDGQIVFGSLDSPLFRVPASGGKPAPLTTLDAARSELGHNWPQLLPGGRLLYWVRSDKRENTGAYVASLARPDKRVKIVTSDANALYAALADGESYLLWPRGQALVAQKFDAAGPKLIGETHLIADRVSKVGNAGHMNVAIANGGVLLYSAFGESSQFTWFNRAGKPLGTVDEPDNYSHFRLSLDGRRAVSNRAGSGSTDLVLLDMVTHLSTRLTLNSSMNFFPVWSPNGRTIVFTAGRNLFRRDADAAVSEQPVIQPQNSQYASDWSRDGRWLLFLENASSTQTDIWTLHVTPDGQAVPGTPDDPNPRPYLRTLFDERYGRFSPEPSPRWVAYQSDESGQYDVYIAAFPDPRNKVRISTGGGRYPEWAPNGREVFYVAPGNKLMAVNLKLGPDSIEPSAPRELFVLPTVETGVTPYDTAPDGLRFLVRATPNASKPLTVIVNWPALLRNGGSAP